jgi:succinate dehydrogenase / fumarate reductase cytochrome b subunit
MRTTFHPVPELRMSRVTTLTQSLVGKKVVMAVSGVVLLGFVLGHMLGNLKIFQGPEHFNAYAEGLRTVGAPFFGRGQLLWLVRIVLIAAAGLHIWAAYVVTRASWAARPVGYRTLRLVETTYAARTLRWGAVIILLFVVYHLLDLTFGAANPAGAGADPYDKVVTDFAPSHWYVTAFYAAAVVMVGLHLRHGLWSAFQTLGWSRRARYRGLRLFADTAAALLVIGFLSVPVMVMFGVVR